MDDPDIDVPYQPPQGNVLGKSDVDLPKPDLVLNPENAERELAKPLTAEEKAEQLRRVQERMALKKKEREELEKKDLIEREKKRREYGKEATVQKQKFEQLEREKIANELKRQKEEDRIARERVREQIAADKAARGAKFARTSGSPAAAPAAASTSSTSVATASTAAKKEYTSARLQFAFPMEPVWWRRLRPTLQ